MVLNRFPVDFSSVDASYLVKVGSSGASELQKNYDAVLEKLVGDGIEQLGRSRESPRQFIRETSVLVTVDVWSYA